MSADVGDGLAAAVAGVAGRFVATLVCGAVVFRTGPQHAEGREICAAVGVTERTLNFICTDYVGLSPHQYLLRRRVNLARALRLADPASKTVTSTANDYGFAELGRFSVTYRALYGESPSATLRRAPDRGG